MLGKWQPSKGANGREALIRAPAQGMLDAALCNGAPTDDSTAKRQRADRVRGAALHTAAYARGE